MSLRMCDLGYGITWPEWLGFVKALHRDCRAEGKASGCAFGVHRVQAITKTRQWKTNTKARKKLRDEYVVTCGRVGRQLS